MFQLQKCIYQPQLTFQCEIYTFSIAPASSKCLNTGYITPMNLPFPEWTRVYIENLNNVTVRFLNELATVPENIKSPTQAKPWTLLVSFGTCPYIKWFNFSYNLYDNMLETLIQPSLQKCRGNTHLILLFKLAISILTIPNTYMLLPLPLTTYYKSPLSSGCLCYQCNCY